MFSLVLYGPYLSFFFNNLLQLRNAPNFLWHDYAILTRCFSKDAQPSFGKRDGKLRVSITGSTFLFMTDQVSMSIAHHFPFLLIRKHIMSMGFS